jgi:hypothetical protein
MAEYDMRCCLFLKIKRSYAVGKKSLEEEEGEGVRCFLFEIFFNSRIKGLDAGTLEGPLIQTRKALAEQSPKLRGTLG